MSSPVLDLKDVTVRAPHRTIVEDIGLSVAAGETVGLVGESGSGKSTTARCALSLLPSGLSASGSITTCGQSVLELSDEQLRVLRATKVAFIHQDPRAALNPVRSIGDLVTERLVHGSHVNRREATARAVELMHGVGLRDAEALLRRHPHELSGGMLQRVVLAAGLTCDPELLIADEATSALDVTTQAEVLALIRRARDERGMGVLLITHDLYLAAAYCDRIYVLREGRLVEQLSGPDLFAAATCDYTRELLAAAPSLSGVTDREAG